MKGQDKKRRWAAAGMTSLSPEGEAALRERLACLRAALAQGAEVDQLRELAASDPDDPAWDFRLLGELAKIPHPAVPPLLAALFGSSPDKERRKALKRALHLLKTRGVAVPEDLLPREEPGRLITPEGPVFRAYVSPLYGNGEGYVILEGDQRQCLGDGNFLLSRISDLEGFRDCRLLSLNKRARQEFWQEFVSGGSERMVPVPPAYAFTLLEEALSLTPDGSPERDEYLGLRESLWRYLGRPEEAPQVVDLLPPLSEADRRQAREDSRKLARQELFFSWLPGLDEINPWLEKLREVQNSPLILTEPQQQMRREMVVDEAAAALYPPADRPRWGRRLLKMAYYLHLKGQTEEARAARAAGEDLLSPERGALAGENPFLQEMAGYALILAEELAKQQEPEPTSPLLVTPPWTT